MIPKVTFKLDIELDIQMTYAFLEWGKSDGGNDFTESIFGPNPELRNINFEIEHEVREYFETFYSSNAKDLQTVIDWNIEHWGEVESKFIGKIIKLFNGHEFPSGKYIGYLSINNCDPRFLDDKTFQMYYKANVYSRTISHELTHFLFYDYTAKRHKDIFGNLDPNSGAYWSFAELFNNVILSLPEYVELLDNYGDGAYPNHEKLYKPLVDIWLDTQEIDKFIVKGFEYVDRVMNKH